MVRKDNYHLFSTFWLMGIRNGNYEFSSRWTDQQHQLLHSHSEVCDLVKTIAIIPIRKRILLGCAMWLAI